MRRWIVNARFLDQGVTGVQRYAYEIVRALDALIAERHPLTQGLRLEAAAPRGARDWDLAHVPLRRFGPGRGHVWEQAALPAHLGEAGLLSLANTGPLTAKRQILCLHDANVWLAPESYRPAFRALYRALLPALARRAAALATVSDFSRRALAGEGVVQGRDIAVIPDAADHVRRWEESGAAALPDLGDCALLIGAAAPHKNLAMALGLRDDLAKLGLRIAVTGGHDARVFTQAPQGDAGALRLGRLSDAELARAMTSCLCLLFPSKTEGFGLPPLEAMALGCPVISSDSASMPEICGDAALYAAPDDPQAWLSQIVRLRDDPQLRARMIALGRARAAGFSWRDGALAYLAEMARLDGFMPAGPSPRPRLAVIVATLGRPRETGALVARLRRQTRPPDIIVLSAPDPTHLPDGAEDRDVRRVLGARGLCAQRNRALDALAGDADIVTFFDDDFVPDDAYLSEVEAAFAAHPDWRVLTGRVARDGARGAGLDLETAEAALAAARVDPSLDRARDVPGAYGCNMSMRAGAIDDARFDERLALYGWQEDIDFSARVGRGGRIVRSTRLIGVHLGVKSGRVSGLRFGYSQIVNPIYLARKGTMPKGFALSLMARNLAANLARSIRPEPYVDRRGRLKGNMLAALDLLRGRVTPERILRL